MPDVDNAAVLPGARRACLSGLPGALAAMLDPDKGAGPMNHAFDLQGEWTVNK